MSTVSVSNIITANGSEPLTIKTGNTIGPSVVVNTNGNITFTSNDVSFSDITSANGTQSLTVKTGNTVGPSMVLNPNGNINFTSTSVSGTVASTGKAIAMSIVFG